MHEARRYRMLFAMRPAAALPVLALVVACGGSAPADSVGGSSDPPPSILLVSIDTLRPDHLGLYGYERDTSPYLDRLAEESLVFDRAYTTLAWTLVAHMSMMTGLYPREHGVDAAKTALSPKVPTVAERLQENGYRTLGFPSDECIWVEPKFGFGRGFDVYEAHPGPEQVRERIDAELDQLADGRPVFLFLHLFDVHTAPMTPGFRGFYDPPPPYDTMYDEDSAELLAHIDCRAAWDDGGTLPPEELEAMIARYDGGVRYVDAQLERIIEGWRERGLLDDALLIITSDHGEALGDHETLGQHGGLYEEGLRIPLIVRFPDGYRAGERESDVTSVVDYAPTILAEARIEEPTGPTLRDTHDQRVIRASHALISDRWKSITAGGEMVDLFDLASDPDEASPVETEHPEYEDAAASLRRRYREVRERRRDLGAPPVPTAGLGEKQKEHLRALGYAGVVDEDG